MQRGHSKHTHTLTRTRTRLRVGKAKGGGGEGGGGGGGGEEASGKAVTPTLLPSSSSTAGLSCFYY